MQCHRIGVCVVALSLTAFMGCGDDKSAEKTTGKTKTVAAVTKTKTVEKKPEVKKPDPAEVWAKALKAANTKLAAGEFETAKQAIKSLGSIYPEGQSPSEEQTTQLAEIKKQLSAAILKRADDSREADLAKAEEQLKLGEYAEATRFLGEVIANTPSDEQRQRHDIMVKTIESRRSKLRDLKNFMVMLASESASDSNAARNALRREPDVALPLLRKSAAQFDKPVLVRNSLETLRYIPQVDETLPIIMNVLSTPEAKANWDDAVRVLSRINAPGVGTAILKMALGAKSSEQRSAALTAFGNASDPPVDTLVQLFPLIYAEPGPDTVAVLRAALRGVQLHGQYDLFARRGFESEMTDEQLDQLAKLPARLDEIKAAAEKNPDIKDSGLVSNALLMALGQSAPQVLEGVKVLSVGGEQEMSPGAKVFDAQWQGVDLATMWVYPTAPNRHFIVLDLGSERTVAGVKIWNYNQQSYPQYGWKLVNISVSNDSTAPEVDGSGIIPMAPGTPDRPDFSTIVPIPYVRGRYVRLECPERWSNAAVSGLAELQVLGF